jgi:tRNA pseudouridine55 synthase
MASGLIVLLINKATRLSDNFLKLPKEYIAEIRFGIETDTMDMEGRITASSHIEKLEYEKLIRILYGFKGIIEQVPPMFSALKHRGQPLYRLARKGREVPRKARTINILNLEILELRQEVLTIRISCSSGTYIRALAHDIGQAYGTGAVLSGLRRTRIGDMDVENSASPEDIARLSKIGMLAGDEGWIIGLEKLFSKAPVLYIKDRYAGQVKNGSRLSALMLEKGGDLKKGLEGNGGPFAGMVSVRSAGGELLAIHRIEECYDKDQKPDMDKLFTKSVVIF